MSNLTLKQLASLYREESIISRDRQSWQEKITVRERRKKQGKNPTQASLWESTLIRRSSKSSALIATSVILAASIGLSACGAATYTEASGLPNTKLTPGAINPLVTQANIRSTICVAGWTATVRPPVSYTNQLKYDQLHSGYNLSGNLNMKNYEEDHIVPLEVGGDPSSTLNLFPQPRNIKLSSYLKDQLENRMHQLVCSGQLSLKIAQRVFLTNWEKGYSKYMGALP